MEKDMVFYNIIMDLLEANSSYKDLLRKSHNLMDNFNSSEALRPGMGCYWCNSQGYDGNGLVHHDDCILVLIRKEVRL